MAVAAYRHAGDDNHLRTFIGKQSQILFHFFIRMSGLIRAVQQIKHLRQVRRNHIRFGNEMTHLFHHLYIEIGVQPTVVAQYRIDNNQSVRLTEVVDKVGNYANLPGRAQISGIDGVEPHPQPFPFGNDFRHFIRQVEKREIGILRMVGKNCRRQGAYLKAHGRKNGNDNRQ